MPDLPEPNSGKSIVSTVLGDCSGTVFAEVVLQCCIITADAHRALEVLEDYYNNLQKPEDQPLRTAIEHVIRTFKSSLFQALIGWL